MDELELAKYVGKKIKHFRVQKGLTQNELGEKIGKKHNTISNYENAVISPEQDALFGMSRALGIRLDDLFPPTNIEDEDNNFEKALSMTQGLDLKEMNFLKQLIEKTLSKDGEDREKFLESLKFTVDYYESRNNN